MTRKITCLLVVLCTLVPTTFAQASPPEPRFEVVSIKPLQGYVMGAGQRRHSDPGQISYPSVHLKFLVMWAYGLESYRVNGGPAWMETQFYDVVAKLPDGATEKQIPAMLQAMLAERFDLKVHWESPIEPTYTLVVGKNGPKLKTSEESSSAKPRRITAPTMGHLEFWRQTMGQFAGYLSIDLGHPVVDMTGIEGTFDIVMDVNPADLEAAHRLMHEAIEPTFAPSIFTAIEELGLKLERRKGPVPHLVVDEARRIPTEN